MPTANLMAHADTVAGRDYRSFGASPAREAWIDVLVGVICILPLLLTAHLPLVDLPGHLARQYVIRDWANSTYLQQFYYVQWALVPNLALEIFVLAARQLMSIDEAVRAFCISTMLLLFLGTRLINRELSGGRARMYRAAPLLCYGGPFQYGFLSYCFGVGLALLLFGFYLWIRTQPLWRLAAVLVPLSFVLLLCHLVAFGLFAIAVGACELTHGFTAAGGLTRRLPLELVKRQLRPVCCLVPVFLVFVWFSPPNGNASADTALKFSTLHEKARSFASILLFASPRLEVGLLALALAGLGVALLSRTVRVDRVGSTAVALLSLIWLLLPHIAFGAAFIDYRMPWAISFFLLAAVVPGSRYCRWFLPLGLYFGTLAIARIGMIAALWVSWEPTLTKLDAALTALPLGARLMVVEGRLPSGGIFRHPTLTRFGSYAVARRQAFDPGIFANMSGQLLYFQPRFAELWRQDDLGESRSALDDLPPDYDYVLVLVPSLARISPRLPLTCQTSGPNFALYKVVPTNDAEPEATRQAGCAG